MKMDNKDLISTSVATRHDYSNLVILSMSTI